MLFFFNTSTLLCNLLKKQFVIRVRDRTNPLSTFCDTRYSEFSAHTAFIFNTDKIYAVEYTPVSSLTIWSRFSFFRIRKVVIGLKKKIDFEFFVEMHNLTQK